MNVKMLSALAAALVGLCAALSAGSSAEKAHKLTLISPRKMADSLHAVIATDRQIDAERMATRLLAASEDRGPLTERGRDGTEAPVCARLLRLANQRIQQRGAEFSYGLRSLWPLHPGHGPQTQVEEAGLGQVAQHPEQNYYTEEELGGRAYFTAIYADRATLTSCVQCHNRHPLSPRRDFQTNDVMGAVVIRVPLEF